MARIQTRTTRLIRKTKVTPFNGLRPGTQEVWHKCSHTTARTQPTCHLRHALNAAEMPHGGELQQPGVLSALCSQMPHSRSKSPDAGVKGGTAMHTALQAHSTSNTHTAARGHSPWDRRAHQGSQPAVCSSCYWAASTSDGHTERAPGRITVGFYEAFPLY